jgi:hypothetical protein
MTQPLRTVVFVAPFFLDATLRFLGAVAALPWVRVGLLSQDPLDRLDKGIRDRLAAHVRLQDALDPQQIADGTRALGRQLGGVDRLLGTLEQLQVPLGQVRDLLGLPGLGEEAARNFRDKARMKDVLRAAGLPTARHRLADSVEAGLAFAAEVGSWPIIVKPPDGAGGIATFQAGDAAELRQALQAHHPAPGRPVLCEEFVHGQERSLEVLSLQGKPAWFSATRYAPPPIDVLRNPWIQWTVLLPREVDDPAPPAVRELGYAALRALGMDSGLSHMEWFLRPDGSVAISEIGARPPGARIVNLMSWAHDADLFRGWAEAVVWDRFAAPERRYAAGCAYFRGQGQGRVKAVHGLGEAQQQVGSLVVETRLPQVGQARSTSYEGEGWAIVRHPDTRVVEQALATLVQTVRVELG